MVKVTDPAGCHDSLREHAGWRDRTSQHTVKAACWDTSWLGAPASGWEDSPPSAVYGRTGGGALGHRPGEGGSHRAAPRAVRRDPYLRGRAYTGRWLLTFVQPDVRRVYWSLVANPCPTRRPTGGRRSVLAAAPLAPLPDTPTSPPRKMYRALAERLRSPRCSRDRGRSGLAAAVFDPGSQIRRPYYAEPQKGKSKIGGLGGAACWRPWSPDPDPQTRRPRQEGRRSALEVVTLVMGIQTGRPRRTGGARVGSRGVKPDPQTRRPRHRTDRSRITVGGFPPPWRLVRRPSTAKGGELRRPPLLANWFGTGFPLCQWGAPPDHSLAKGGLGGSAP